MKRTFTLLAAALMAATAQLQAQGLTSHKFFDNWSVGVNVGATSPVTPYRWKGDTKANWHFFDSREVQGFSWDGFRKTARLNFGLELTKQWSPSFGTGVEATAYVNTTPNHTMIDEISGTLFGKANLTNIFFGYKGKPRVFEVQARAGISWNTLLVSYKGSHTEYGGAKFGLDFDFNLGKKRAWTLSLKPTANFNIDGQRFSQYAYKNGTKLDKNGLRVEVQAGLTYHFKNSNGAHHFLNVPAYDQSEIDGLNAQINHLRGQISDKEGLINNVNARINDVQNQLQAALKQKPEVVEKPSKDFKKADLYVHFRVNQNIIDASQLPNVDRIARFLQKNKDAKIVIKGYASPEGPDAVNQRLSIDRAAAVKKMLVKKYKIAADRISAEGLGVGDIFSEPTWNRVSVGTLE